MSDIKDEKLLNAMRHCHIFKGIPEDRYINVLSCLEGEIRTFEKDEVLNAGNKNCTSGIVLDGVISQNIIDENGNLINVSHIYEGNVFGADRSVAQVEGNPFELRAMSVCRILFLNFSVLLLPNSSNCPSRSRMASNLLKDFARQTLFLSQRIQIICQKKLRDKIKIYLRTLSMENDNIFYIPFSRQELADYLYADRSALSRELSKMRDEGIIEMKKRSLRLLDSSFLF